jgi:hypothetical protein
MRLRFAILVVTLLVMVALSPGAQTGVGLGVLVGAAFPDGGTSEIPGEAWDGSFNWGFFVDIPLLSTFRLSPSSELYKFGEENATDMALAFTFVVPLASLDLYGGIVPGITTTGDITAVHVGGLVGAAFGLLGNIDLFVQGKYKVVFHDDENLRVLHLNTGLLFVF